MKGLLLLGNTEKMGKGSIERVLPGVFIFALFMYIFRWVCPLMMMCLHTRIIIGQIPNMLLLAIDILCIIKYKGEVFRRVYDVLSSPPKALIILMLFYLFYDAMGLLYSKHPEYSLSKYVDLIQLLLYFVNGAMLISWYNGRYVLRLIGIALAGTALLISIVAWIGYISGEYTVYANRLSTILDYNVFSCSLLVGGLFLMYFFEDSNWAYSYSRSIITALLLSFMFAAAYLSSSRRAFLYMIASTIVIASVGVVQLVKSKKMTGKKLSRDCFSVMTLLILTAAWVVIFPRLGDFNIINEAGEMDESITAGTTTEKRIESMVEGDGFDTRVAIWKSSMKWIYNMSKRELVIGGGQSYSFDVFEIKSQNNNEAINEYGGSSALGPMWMHPHNLFLTEFLEGGVIKLILVILLMASSLSSLLRTIKRDLIAGKYIICIYLITFGNLMLGARYGITGSCLVWLIMLINTCDNNCRIKTP